jgi:hypothetical protein
VSGRTPSAIAVPARVSGTRVPIEPTSRPDSGAKITVISAIGTV